MTSLNKTGYVHPILNNFGYVQQYKHHLRDNARYGKDTCSCMVWCSDSAMYADKIKGFKQMKLYLCDSCNTLATVTHEGNTITISQCLCTTKGN